MRTLADIAVEAMRAGMRGERLPNFGDRLTREQIQVVNSVYEEARNSHSASKFASSRKR